MPDVKLSQPEAGQKVVVSSTDASRFVFEFPTDEAVMDHPQGSDNLVFNFSDGSSVEIKDFYKQYNKDEMPEFEVDGQIIAGKDFFDAFGPDLMPAAGPSSNSNSVANGNRFHDWYNSNLMNGIDHLNGLDVHYNRSSDIKFTEETHGIDNEDNIDTTSEIRTTTASISTSNVVEGDTSYVIFTVELSTPPQESSTVQIQVDNKIYTVSIDKNGFGILKLPTNNSEDPYQDQSTITAKIVNVIGGTYDVVDIVKDIATARVDDTVDITKVEISVNNINESNNNITFNIQLSNSPDPNSSEPTIVQVEIANTIYPVPIDADGHGTLVIPNQNHDDKYLDASSITAKVVSVTGGNFEKVDVTGAIAKAVISDTIDPTTVTITTNNTDEGQNLIQFDIQLSTPPDPTYNVRPQPKFRLEIRSMLSK